MRLVPQLLDHAVVQGEVAAADLDSDGQLELLVTTGDASAGQWSVEARETLGGAALWRRDGLGLVAVLSDASGDGQPDVLASPFPAHDAHSHVLAVLAGVDGREVARLDAPRESIAGAPAGDWDGDRRPDLALTWHDHEARTAGVQVRAAAPGLPLLFECVFPDAPARITDVVAFVDEDGEPRLVLAFPALPRSLAEDEIAAGELVPGAVLVLDRNAHVVGRIALDTLDSRVTVELLRTGAALPHVLVGLPAADGRRGRLEVRALDTGELLRRIPGEQPDEQLGAALLAVGDIDGDAVADALVGAPATYDDRRRGRVLLLSGRDLRLAPFVSRDELPSQGGDPRGAFFDEPGAEAFGDGLALLGDLDRDGRPEFLVEEPRLLPADLRVFVFALRPAIR